MPSLKISPAWLLRSVLVASLLLSGFARPAAAGPFTPPDLTVFGDFGDLGCSAGFIGCLTITWAGSSFSMVTDDPVNYPLIASLDPGAGPNLPSFVTMSGTWNGVTGWFSVIDIGDGVTGGLGAWASGTTVVAGAIIGVVGTGALFDAVADLSVFGGVSLLGQGNYVTLHMASFNYDSLLGTGTFNADVYPTVSEPVSLALLGVGAAGVAALRRRRSRRI